MSVINGKHSPTKFYQEDIVQRISAPHNYGLILRCWHDAEELPPPPSPVVDPMMRPLKRGEVGVSFFPTGQREILPECEFVLVDRSFQPGDFCKRSIDDLRSGVVTGVEVKGILEHAISGILVEGWKSIEDLETRKEADIGDYVVYDDWIGQVIELYDESIVEVSGGQLVRLPELSSRLTVGEKGSDILPPPIGGMQSLFGFLIGNSRPSNVDTVVAVKHTVLAIAWLAVNQSLDPEIAQTRKRPQRFWFGHDLSKLTMVRSKSDQDMRVGDKVLLRNSVGLPLTTHGQEGDPGVVVVRTLVVRQTCTAVAVLWQDGIHESVRSVDLIPYLNPDESDCWPGDHVVWKNENQKRAATVQSVNAADRTAAILFADTGRIELASLLELDPHGTSDVVANPHLANEGLGVRRGDFVFIHQEGTTNGLEKPRVPRIGEIEAWVREAPITSDGQLGGWRKEMSEIGGNIATSRGGTDNVEEGQICRPTRGDGSFSWFGEVTALQLDGTVEVMHPDLSRSIYPLERLTKLHDGIEQLEDDMWGDDMSDTQGSDGNEPVWATDEHGVWHLQNMQDSDEWEETDEDDNDDDAMDVDEPGWDLEPLSGLPDHMPALITISRPDTPRALDYIPSANKTVPVPPIPTPVGEFPNLPKEVHDDERSDESNEGLPWKRFDIISSAPPDHAFYSSAPALPSKSFLGRLAREYRVLANSLPQSIIVRAYEDRTDLLRSLIIGPENTPYEDAPFVIDWMLDSNFPTSPPIAHFHSFTNGNGRVNPNLYEEGKVCLSILGTWAGDRNEIWSAARSSLLQAFVSIQGLVLVKEPWFCEPAYEKLRGTEEGIVNSRLYSEKAYVLSRGFVRRALEIPFGGLESEINWMYFTNKLLEKVVLDAHLLIEKSRSPQIGSEDNSDLAIPRLTAGGIIALDRTLLKLQAILDAHGRTLV